MARDVLTEKCAGGIVSCTPSLLVFWDASMLIDANVVGC